MKTELALQNRRDPSPTDVRFWHKADIPTRSIDVCFEGKSGH